MQHLLRCTFEQELLLITIMYFFSQKSNVEMRREYIDPDFYSRVQME